MQQVVRMGPCGGGGGNGRDVDMRGVDRVVKVAVRHGHTVDAVSVLYDRSGREEWTDLWGGPGGGLTEICLRSDEYFTGVEGHCGEFEGNYVVRSLTFLTNLRAYGPYGAQDGVPFALPAAGGRILGFHARSGRHLDAIGTYVKVEEPRH
ncbi:hypothetical protein EJB05_48107, partial [Eragrostis curvula]